MASSENDYPSWRQGSSTSTSAAVASHRPRSYVWTIGENKGRFMLEFFFEKYELLPVLVVLNEWLLRATKFVINTRLGKANDFAAEARVQDPNLCLAVDGALHITKAYATN